MSNLFHPFSVRSARGPNNVPLGAMSTAAAVAAAALIGMPCAQAQVPPLPPGGVGGAAVTNAVETLKVDAGKGTMVTLKQDATSVFVADPAIADVNVPSPKNVFVLGKKPGSTTLYVMGENNKPLMQRTILVERNLDVVRNTLDGRFPRMHLQVSAGGGSLTVSGQAENADDANAVVQIMKSYLLDKEVLVNQITVAKPVQVQLQVRITEVDRNVTQELGINWSSLGHLAGNWLIGPINSGRQLIDYANPYTTATGATAYPNIIPSNNAFAIGAGFNTNNTSLNAVIDALNQEGLITVLAEPNLVAMSGQTASFLAGGEFPIPVSQINGAISVDFKQFGVKLDFTPTVLNDNRISLKVRPEVSQIDTTASVTTNGITIPGLSVRRLDTTVELTSGQSFAIGGLLSSTATDTVSQVPGLGSLPIIGKLFSSSNYQNKKTELVIMVTPYIVNPSNPQKLRGALDSLVSPISDIEYSFSHRSASDVSNSNAPRLMGSAGFVY